MDKKAKVKQELPLKSISEKITYGENVTGMMGGDATFATIAALISAAADATTELETAKNAKDAAEAAAKAATDVQHTKEEEFDEAFTELGNGVDNIAKGDKTIIDKAGMDSFFPGKAAPVGEMPQVINLSASEGDGDGEIDLHWDKVKGASSYVIERATPNPSGFTFTGNSTKTSITIKSLTSGTKYWFKVAAIGSAGTGPFSDPATKIAP